MWSLFSKIFCGSFGRIFQTQEAIENSPMTEPLEKDSPIRIVSESPSCKSCSERDETSASEKDQELKPSQPRNPPGSYYSESIAKQFSANFEGRNPAEVERVKMDFLDQCRSKYAAPQTHDEMLKNQGDREMLELKAKYLDIQSKHATDTSPLAVEKRSKERSFFASWFC